MTAGIISLKLQKYLLSKVNGKVYVSIYNSKVNVSIEYSENDLWCTTLPILRAYVSEAKMVRILSQIILTRYEEYIFNKYFIK